jgi:hypothetical protein
MLFRRRAGARQHGVEPFQFGNQQWEILSGAGDQLEIGACCASQLNILPRRADETGPAVVIASFEKRCPRPWRGCRKKLLQVFEVGAAEC